MILVSVIRAPVLRHATAILCAAWLVSVPAPGHDDARNQPQAPRARPPVLRRTLLVDSMQVQDDIRPFVAEITSRYGNEEWIDGIVASELHRHLGVYSIIGVKMALRARTLLGADYDNVRVRSWAGLTPPLSCVNDGLQVGAGASLGRGTISVDTSRPRVEAEFESGDARIVLSLKADVERRFNGEFARLAKELGDQTPAYFEAVRRTSMIFWRDLDRTKIFDVRVLHAPEPAAPPQK